MRRTMITLASVAALSLALVHPAGGITNGEPDAGRHPYVGALIAEFEPGVVGPFCSGTLISPTVFLTAAHCILGAEEFGLDPFWVTFDSPADSTATRLGGEAFIAPGAWAGGFNDPLDLAVFVLDEEVQGIDPAVLPTAGLLDDHKALRSQTFTTVGYGSTRDTQQGGWQPIDFENTERNVATQSFLSLQKAWLLLSMNPATGNGGTCYGDSGGPHFLGGLASNLVVSVTVTGDTWCKATDKTYRLDTPQAREFLSGYVTLP